MHLHARNVETGQPDQSPEAFAPFLKIIKQRSNCVVNLTTGGSPTMMVEERVRPASTRCIGEVASLNMGSMNFGLFGMLNRFKDFKHDWERKHLENKDIVFRNTFKDIEFVLRTLSGSGTRFEFECYDTAHLHNLNYFLMEGLVKPPLFVQTVFGLQGGIGAHPDEVMHMKRTADRLFGDKYRWSVLGAGRNPTPDRGDGGGDGRQRPRRSGGFAVGRTGPACRDQCRAGPRGAQDHRGGWGLKWRPPMKRARFCTSRAVIR